MFKSIKKGKFSEYFASWTAYKRERGMTRVYDMIDWLGGLPYEFASVAALTDFYEKDGFKLEKLIENSNTGCHELLFRRSAWMFPSPGVIIRRAALSTTIET